MPDKVWDLEERRCLCGCGLAFRCLPKSTARFASIYHEPLFSHKDFAFRDVGFKKKLKKLVIETEEKIHSLELVCFAD
jgi:hypothetical protein